MKEQITELLKLLNKGAEHLPDTVNVVVQQYAMRKWVETVGLLIFTVLLLLASFFAMRWAHNYEPINSSDDFYSIGYIGGFVALIAAVFMLSTAIVSMADAVSPIYSMIQDLR